MRIRSYSISKLCESADTGLLDLQGFILSLHASIVSVHFEPLKLLNFDFIADPDPDLDPHPLPTDT